MFFFVVRFFGFFFFLLKIVVLWVEENLFSGDKRNKNPVLLKDVDGRLNRSLQN